MTTEQGSRMLCKLSGITNNGFLSKLHTSRDAAVKTRYVVFHNVVRNSEPFTDGQFVKMTFWTEYWYLILNSEN